MWDHAPTSDIVAGWLAANSNEPLSLQQAAELLAREGSLWIDKISNALGTFQPHTFILAGFSEDTATLALISNTQTVSGSMPRRQGTGLALTMLQTLKAHVYVTGIANAVSHAERILLKRLAHAEVDPNLMRYKMAQVNARAAKTREANNGVSDACLCYSLGASGAGAGELHGKVQGAFIPIHIQNGIDLNTHLSKILSLGSGAQVRSVAMSTSRSSDEAAQQRVSCSIQTDSAVNGSGLELVDIGDVSRLILEPTGINSQWTVVGSVRHPIGAAPQAFVWSYGGAVRCLGTLGGSTSRASAVNIHGVVVGMATRPDGIGRAFVWREGNDGLQDLGNLSGDYATANAINDLGTVVGGANIIPGQNGQYGERAFVWNQPTGMVPIPGVQDSWSFARDINKFGEVVGWYQPNGRPYSFFWSVETGVLIIDGLEGRGFFARAINDYGTVIGEGDDASGARRAMIWTRQDGLRVLDLPPGVHLQAIDEAGNMVARELSLPWTRPWLIRPDLSAVQLSTAEEHHTEPAAISNGLIIGVAKKEDWRHSHIVAWCDGKTANFFRQLQSGEA
jgi:probable HAF family extracellular repeat protein